MGGRRNGRFFEGGGEGPNSESIFPIRLHIISGRRGGGGGGCQIFNYLPFLPPTTLLNGTALTQFTRMIIATLYIDLAKQNVLLYVI